MKIEKEGLRNYHPTPASTLTGDNKFEKAVSIVPSKISHRVNAPNDGESESELDFLNDVFRANEKLRNEELHSTTTTTKDLDVHQHNDELVKEYDEMIKEKENPVSPDNDIPETSLHRNNVGIQRQGAISINPTQRNMQNQDHTADDTENGEVHNSQGRYEVEAVLVVPQEVKNRDVEQAIVQPAHVAEAKVIDEKALFEEAERAMERKKLRRNLIVIVVIVGLLLAAVMVVVLVRKNNKKSNNDTNSINSSSQQQNPNSTIANQTTNYIPARSTVFNPMDVSLYPTITQHAILFEARMDCDTILSETPPNMFTRIHCGNTNIEDGIEAIQLESQSGNVNCLKEKDNNVECTANIMGKVARFAVIITCGTNYTQNPNVDYERFSYLSVRTFPLTSIGCRSEPILSVGIARLCGNASSKAANWTLRPAMVDSESCPMNPFLLKSGNWSLCQTEASCGTGEYPCTENITLGESISYDYLDDDNCKNPGGSLTHYKPIDKANIWNELDPIYRSLNDNS